MKINYKKELFKGFSGLCESVFCAPFEDPIKFSEDKFENDRFRVLIDTGKDFLEFSTIENADYVIIPYKWDNYSDNTKTIIDEAKKNGKKVIALHNDDFAPKMKLKDEDGYLFTTTITKGSNEINEFSFPSFTGDFFMSESNINRKIGFCGALTHPLRTDVLSKLSSSDMETDFIIRSGFFAPELSKDQARIEYFSHIDRNTFNLCIRGAGNFSYRFYETMMMGRIPIIVDSNQIFPFEKHLDYSEFSIRIDYKEEDIIGYIKSEINKLTDEKIVNMQKTSRKLWKEFMSPEGWVKNFTKEL